MNRPQMLTAIANRLALCSPATGGCPTSVSPAAINASIQKLQADQNVQSCVQMFGPGQLDLCVVGTSNLNSIYTAWSLVTAGSPSNPINWSIILDHLMDGH